MRPGPPRHFRLLPLLQSFYFHGILFLELIVRHAHPRRPPAAAARREPALPVGNQWLQLVISPVESREFV
eukprot:scaffold160_cov103-Isochrysis_galbana.AAC.2